MITSVVVDIGAANAEKRRILEHIGQIIVTLASTDQHLAEFLNGIGDKTPRGYKARVEALVRAIRPWPDATLLGDRMKLLGDYRDRLGHSVLVTRIAVLTGDIHHGGIREKTGLSVEPIDPTMLLAWETRAAIVDRIMRELVSRSALGYRPGVDLDPSDSSMQGRTLRSMALPFTDTDPDVRAAVDYLFP